ncbi:MAG TPA: isoprenylcysteine carboxylmethyltransferase family protein [Alphaproteobacteria bacterium]|jgi:protein-S-isoprenylcysteine O-methyltransferase Ste14
MSDVPPRRDAPNVVAPPPLILLAFLSAGFALDWLRPAAFLPSAVQYALGAALIALAVALAAAAMTCFLRAGTNIPTYRPATALVVVGPYRFTRNPIYAGMLLFVLGLGVVIDNIWLMALAVPFALMLRYGVIAREERYLDAKFGEAYRAYRAKVRRWI